MKYGILKDEDEGAFDKLFDDDEVFSVGELNAEVFLVPAGSYTGLYWIFERM